MCIGITSLSDYWEQFFWWVFKVNTHHLRDAVLVSVQFEHLPRQKHRFWWVPNLGTHHFQGSALKNIAFGKWSFWPLTTFRIQLWCVFKMNAHYFRFGIMHTFDGQKENTDNPAWDLSAFHFARCTIWMVVRHHDRNIQSHWRESFKSPSALSQVPFQVVPAPDPLSLMRITATTAFSESVEFARRSSQSDSWMKPPFPSARLSPLSLQTFAQHSVSLGRVVFNCAAFHPCPSRVLRQRVFSLHRYPDMGMQNYSRFQKKFWKILRNKKIPLSCLVKRNKGLSTFISDLYRP